MSLALFLVSILPGVVLISYYRKIFTEEKISPFLEAARIIRDSIYISSASFIISLLAAKFFGNITLILDLVFEPNLVIHHKYEALIFFGIIVISNITIPHLVGLFLVRIKYKDLLINKSAWTLTFEKYKEEVDKIGLDKCSIIVTVVTSAVVAEGTLEQYSTKHNYDEREIALSEVSFFKNYGDEKSIGNKVSGMVVIPGSDIKTIMVRAELK